jgi:hypothetical protein
LPPRADVARRHQHVRVGLGTTLAMAILSLVIAGSMRIKLGRLTH